MATDRTALLIIRVWVEAGSSTPLRVHLRQTTDISAGFEGAFVMSDAGAVAEAVRAWLDRVQELAGTATS